MDLEVVGKKALKEIHEVAQSYSPKKEVELEDTSTGTTTPAKSLVEGERAGGQRVRVKPSWMKEFVRMERS